MPGEARNINSRAHWDPAGGMRVSVLASPDWLGEWFLYFGNLEPGIETGAQRIH